MRDGEYTGNSITIINNEKYSNKFDSLAMDFSNSIRRSCLMKKPEITNLVTLSAVKKCFSRQNYAKNGRVYIQYQSLLGENPRIVTTYCSLVHGLEGVHKDGEAS